ncbi:DNA mismatch repair protein MutS [Mucilaginibacter sp. L3T2-6]|uniref:MutS-related protein n=1 Tax=Mucilaginibacter sp. L3T2-6 TaxID=3062491 RepID=UPI00267700BD|nr:DNA mismatch repair protein MutS [Mucilaginibacter sp. L3T2-6]MDO3642645.1 DNA mismatch repair protein MutS [Mucilaginibacter sp. L3T2-6]MDV6214959.1 DNA mismatch repair protein MutS [Mucilaginibacter sp. L3T2-6]
MDILADYRRRADLAQHEADKYKSLANTYSLYRLLVFGLFIVIVCVAISVEEIAPIIVAVVILVACFSWLINKQNRYEELKNYFIDLHAVIENEITSIESYKNIYDNGLIFNEDKHFYTADLDIFGNGSLYQLTNRAATFPGIVKLAGWLVKPAAKPVIMERQQAVAEIAGKNDWKLNTQAHLLFSLKQNREQIKRLVEYLKAPIEINGEKVLATYSKISPYLVLALITGSIFYMPLRYVTPVVILVNIRLVMAKAKLVQKADLIAGKIGTTLHHFVLAFKSIENEEWRSAYLKNLGVQVRNENGESISGKIEQLAQLINKLNYRLNMVMMFILNALFIWDIRQLIAIENWKRNNLVHIEAAFDVVAEFEAVMSLASLKINYPDWSFPEITDGESYTLTANKIAHPLISADKRIANDYELNDTFKIDIITGSNMAGKSTFLRTIGINTVLALCGAPVCADRMQVSVVTIITYMRIKDSLNESTSTFKAELDRLQMLLNAVVNEPKVFFLIDEMLRGTNSVDKYRGSKAVIEQLIRKKGVGMVATHDLQIAELEESHPDYVRNFYFDIQVKGGEMLFDYKIKHGECKTFNASLLLKQIGIEVGD